MIKLQRGAKMLSVKEKTDHKKVIMDHAEEALRPAFVYGCLEGMGLPDEDLQRAADNTDDVAAMIDGLSHSGKMFLLLLMRCREDEGYLDKFREDIGLAVN